MIHGTPEIMHLAVDLHVDLIKVPLPVRVSRIASTRFFRISAANIGPNLFHHSRTVSWQMSMPRCARRSSTLRREADSERTS